MNYLPNTVEKKTKRRWQPQPSEEKQPFSRKLYKKNFFLWLTSLRDKSEDNVKSSLYRYVSLALSGLLAGAQRFSQPDSGQLCFCDSAPEPHETRTPACHDQDRERKLERPGGLPWRPSQAGCSQAIPPKAIFPQIICPVIGRSSCRWRIISQTLRKSIGCARACVHRKSCPRVLNSVVVKP